MSHTDRHCTSRMPSDLLVLCRAQIELRHFGGAVGLKLIDEIVNMSSDDRAEALSLLIRQVKSNEIELQESEDEQ